MHALMFILTLKLFQSVVRNVRNNRKICSNNSKVLWELLKRIMGEMCSIMYSSYLQYCYFTVYSTNSTVDNM